MVTLSQECFVFLSCIILVEAIIKELRFLTLQFEWCLANGRSFSRVFALTLYFNCSSLQGFVLFSYSSSLIVLSFLLQYPIPMRKETQGRTDLYIASWLKDQARDKVLHANCLIKFFSLGYSRINSLIQCWDDLCLWMPTKLNHFTK